MPQRMIWVTFQREGIHRYPDAPEEVSFLRHPHRHNFQFRVSIEVSHQNREIEFLMFKRELECLYGEGTLELDGKSCEMLADDLYGFISERYPNREVWIEVSEDGENGAYIRYSA